jgi:hypothetical protein
MIKPRTITRVGHVTYMEAMKNACRILDSPKETDHSEDLGVDGRRIFKWS